MLLDLELITLFYSRSAAPLTVLCRFTRGEATGLALGEAAGLETEVFNLGEGFAFATLVFLTILGLDLVFLGAETDRDWADLPPADMIDFDALRLEGATDKFDAFEITLFLETVFFRGFFFEAEALDWKDMLSLSSATFFIFFFAFKASP